MTPLILDANSLYARSFFAAMASPEWQSKPDAGAVHLAMRTLLRLLDPQNDSMIRVPTHMLACWDGAQKREKHRAPKPEGYEAGKAQMQTALELMLHCPSVASEIEADDACATAVMQTKKLTKEEIFVVSGDKDLQQLVDDQVSYYCLNDKGIASHGSICRRWNIKKPEQLSIALAIIGDAGDAIQGVRRWGHAKVKKLFADVTPEMSLFEVAEYMASFMNAEQLADFQDSLNLTLLRTDLPGIIDPQPIVFCDKGVLDILELESLWPQIEILSL